MSEIGAFLGEVANSAFPLIKQELVTDDRGPTFCFTTADALVGILSCFEGKLVVPMRSCQEGRVNFTDQSTGTGTIRWNCFEELPQEPRAKRRLAYFTTAADARDILYARQMKEVCYSVERLRERIFEPAPEGFEKVLRCDLRCDDHVGHSFCLVPSRYGTCWILDSFDQMHSLWARWETGAKIPLSADEVEALLTGICTLASKRDKDPYRLEMPRGGARIGVAPYKVRGERKPLFNGLHLLFEERTWSLKRAKKTHALLMGRLCRNPTHFIAEKLHAFSITVELMSAQSDSSWRWHAEAPRLVAHALEKDLEQTQFEVTERVQKLFAILLYGRVSPDLRLPEWVTLCCPKVSALFYSVRKYAHYNPRGW